MQNVKKNQKIGENMKELFQCFTILKILTQQNKKIKEIRKNRGDSFAHTYNTIKQLFKKLQAFTQDTYFLPYY